MNPHFPAGDDDDEEEEEGLGGLRLDGDEDGDSEGFDDDDDDGMEGLIDDSAALVGRAGSKKKVLGKKGSSGATAMYKDFFGDGDEGDEDPGAGELLGSLGLRGEGGPRP